MIEVAVLYIDPSTGSAIAAAVLGVIAGASMYIKTKWDSIRNKIKTSD
mgnify:CR=1 FL=1|jgi:hypothetical protein|tara:strand:+ start:1577 stop:1720 length:144 start_codon:yes stop_codon:yes gene_type:complete